MLSLVKLSSGVEIVGEIVEVDNTFLTIKNPLQIAVFNRPNGASGIMSNRYSSFSTQEAYKINASHVECVCRPINEIDEYYQQSLSIIKEHIDPSLVEDFKRLQDVDEEEPEKELTKESYLAMIEKMMLKKPLN
jgi:hypothetical protein